MPDSNSILILSSVEMVRTALTRVLGDECSRTAVISDGDTDEVAHLLQKFSITTVFLDLSSGYPHTHELVGVRLAQKLRRDYGFRGSIIFLGVRPLGLIHEQYRLLGPDVPGSEYIQLPVTARRICQALGKRHCLTEAELDAVVRTCCDEREQVQSAMHELVKLLNRTFHQEDAGPNARQWAAIRTHGLSLYNYLSTLDSSIVDDDVLNSLDVLATGSNLSYEQTESLLLQLEKIYIMPNFGRPTSSPGLLIVPPSAPSGYETVLIADDEELPPQFIALLEQYGYYIEITSSYAETAQMLLSDPHAVFVCDQTFGEDSMAGKRLMALARQHPACRLIIALSGSTLDPNDVPEAHVVCSGPSARTQEGARKLHEEICRWAGQ